MMSELESIVTEVLGRTGATSRSTGVAVAGARNGSIHLASTRGLRDRASSQPVTSSTLFDLGSLTKAFTALALLRAHEGGRMDLAAPLRGWLDFDWPDPEAAAELCLLDLLSHRSGLPAHHLLWYRRADGPLDLAEVLPHLSMLPGGFRRTFAYTNLGYGLLGQKMEKLTGAPWAASVASAVLEPLGIENASLGTATEEVDVAHPYAGGQRLERLDAEAVAAAGAMRVSLDDVARWVEWLSGGPAHRASIVSPEALERAFRAHVALTQPEPMMQLGWTWLETIQGYGLGWFVGVAHGRRVAFHPGFVDGFSTAIAVLPDDGVAFAAMANDHLSALPGMVVGELVRAAVGDPTPRSEADEADPALPRDGASARETQMAAEVTPDDWNVEGVYAHPAYGCVTVRREADGLVFDGPGPRWPLRRTGEDAGEVIVAPFGLTTPLPVRFERASGARPRRFEVPLSMDPRLPPEVFTRVTDSA